MDGASGLGTAAGGAGSGRSSQPAAIPNTLTARAPAELERADFTAVVGLCFFVFLCFRCLET